MSLPSALFSAVALTLRDAANNAAPQDEISNLRGEERGNAARRTTRPQGARLSVGQLEQVQFTRNLVHSI